MAARAILNKIEPKIEVLSDTVVGLKESLEGTDACVQDVYDVQETIQDRVDVLEEEVTSLKVQKAGLINHLNMVIKEVNNMKAWLKKHYNEHIDNVVDDDDVVSVDDLYCHEKFDFTNISDEE